MAIFKCKQCGEALDLSTAENGVCKCKFCDMYQTVSVRVEATPNLEAFYGNASHFRKNGEFDLAISVYQQILAIDDTDAEAYFNVALCRYGIEYVMDPTTGATLTTVNRTQLKAFSDDDDFQMALSYATESQKEIFKAEAQVIDEILKGYWQISNNEEPFDVFICYKETEIDSPTTRTEDSVIAQSLYRELTRDGLKVFYARETLKGKLGSEYEPYIFAALNSARFMLSIGTKREHFNAVWVKNEWSRYLTLMAQGKKKTLIPVYKNMDPYDLPKEFKNLQAQNYAELGATDNIVLAIENVLKQEGRDIGRLTEASLEDLVIKAYSLVKQGKREQANDCADVILSKSFECGDAYFVKLLCEGNYEGVEAFVAKGKDFFENPNFKKALRYANDRLKDILHQAIYNNAIVNMKTNKVHTALAMFSSIKDYKDVSRNISCCHYLIALDLMSRGEYEKALSIFNQLGDIADAKKMAAECQAGIEKQKMEQKKKTKKKVIIIAACIALCVLIPISILLMLNIDTGTHGGTGNGNTDVGGSDNPSDGDMEAPKFTFASVEGGYQLIRITTEDTHVDIPSTFDGQPVVSIGNNVFGQFAYDIESITIPGSVKKISEYAFEATGLKSVVIENGVEEIGSFAFLGCTGIKEISLPGSIKFLSSAAFAECKGLSSITISPDVQKEAIEPYSFEGFNIKNATVPTHLITYIPKDNLEEISINGGYYIEDGALDGLNLNYSEYNNGKYLSCGDNRFYMLVDIIDKTADEITIDKDTNIIYQKALANCYNVTHIDIPTYVHYIGSNAFEGCSALTSVAFPRDIFEVGANLFASCDSFEDVYITDINSWLRLDIGIYNTSWNLFLNDERVKNLVIPEGIFHLTHSLHNCSLNNVYIHNGVKSIPQYLFSGFTNIYCESPAKPISWESGWNTGDDYTHWGCKMTDDGLIYKIEDNSATICMYSGNGGSVTIPSHIEGIYVTAIEDLAFVSCTSVSSVTVSYGVKTIGERAFLGCTSLEEVNIPDSVTTIEDGAFLACPSLKKITVPENFDGDGDGWEGSSRMIFDFCWHVNGDGVLYIAKYFGPNEVVTIPQVINNKTVTRIGSSAFAQNDTIKTLIIPDCIDTIDTTAFDSCTSLEKVYISSSVTVISNFAFAGCVNATFYCEAPATPSTWSSNWCDSKCKVYYNAQMPSDIDQ